MTAASTYMTIHHSSLRMTDIAGVSAHWPGGGVAEESECAAGGDGLHHHQAEAGAAGQGQHCGDAAAADQNEDVSQPYLSEEPDDECSGRLAR